MLTTKRLELINLTIYVLATQLSVSWLIDEDLHRLIYLSQRPCQIDPSAACSVTSAQIEQCYNRNQRGVMEFYTAKYTYRLDFSGKVTLKLLHQTDNIQPTESDREVVKNCG